MWDCMLQVISSEKRFLSQFFHGLLNSILVSLFKFLVQSTFQIFLWLSTFQHSSARQKCKAKMQGKNAGKRRRVKMKECSKAFLLTNLLLLREWALNLLLGSISSPLISASLTLKNDKKIETFCYITFLILEKPQSINVNAPYGTWPPCIDQMCGNYTQFYPMRLHFTISA